MTRSLILILQSDCPQPAWHAVLIKTVEVGHLSFVAADLPLQMFDLSSGIVAGQVKLLLFFLEEVPEAVELLEGLGVGLFVTAILLSEGVGMGFVGILVNYLLVDVVFGLLLVQYLQYPPSTVARVGTLFPFQLRFSVFADPSISLCKIVMPLF